MGVSSFDLFRVGRKVFVLFGSSIKSCGGLNHYEYEGPIFSNYAPVSDTSSMAQQSVCSYVDLEIRMFLYTYPYIYVNMYIYIYKPQDIYIQV